MIYQLICEGSCNPNLGSVEALMTRYAAAKQRDVPFVEEESMRLLQRTLRHTSHEVNHESAVCQLCETGRRYGGNPPLVRTAWGMT